MLFLFRTMRNLFLFLILLTGLNLTAIAQDPPTVYLDFPDIAFSDIPTKVGIREADSDTIPPFFLQVRSESVDTLWVQQTEDSLLYIEPHFESGSLLTFARFKTMGKRPSIIPLWMSVLPPLIAIFLALVFKEVIFSLVSGIFIGSAILGIYADGAIGIITGFFKIIDTYLLGALNDADHLSVLLFSLLIGGIVALISRNGGMQGIVNSISRFANNARNGQLATWALGIAIFFDDYANTLVVGNTMRAVTDRLKVSREKLAYIVDSTAAPVSAIAFVTTWIGAELDYIQGGLDNINANGEVISDGPYSIFLNSLQYSFYPILTLFFIFWLVWRGKDFGPMLKAERRARKGEIVNPEENTADLTELEDLEPAIGTEPRAYNAVVPVAIIVFGTLIGLLYTGFEAATAAILEQKPDLLIASYSDVWSNLSVIGSPESFGSKLGTVIGLSNSYAALLWASLSSLFFAMILTMAHRSLNLKRTVETVVMGFKTMVPALMILIMAWSLAAVTEEMHTAEFLTQIMGETLAPWIVPTLTFVLAAFVAFSTGSSWSTMALVYPLVLPAVWGLCMDPEYAYGHGDAMLIFYNTVSAVLAGSVLGDHCSPISDTTILSSLASGCNHIDHVRTQIPYALTVGFIAITCGTLPSALGLHPLIGMALGIGLCILVIELVGKKVKRRVFE